jgi:hypothetical protein
MNPATSPTEHELYTLHNLAEQANANAEPLQVLQHLQANVAALQQQVENMQTSVQAQVESLSHGQEPLISLQAAIESISHQCHETMQSNHTVLSGMNTVLTNLVNRPTTSSRGRVPSPLNTKFTGVDKDLSFSDFKAKLTNAFTYFPESLSTDHDKVHYALNTMDTPAFSYFSPYLSGEVVDSDSILNDYSNFLSTLERLYGNKNKTHSIESKLSNLRQTGSVTEYITRVSHCRVEPG